MKLTILILPLIIFLNCTNSLGTELNFPQEETVKSGDTFKICFSPDGGLELAKIYKSYLGLLDIQEEYKKQILSQGEEIRLLNIKEDLYIRELRDYKLLYDVVSAERDENYQLFLEQKKISDKNSRYYKIKLIGLSLGSGIVGVGLGLILGTFLL